MQKPKKTSTKGAKIMVAVAVFLGLAAVAVFITVAVHFASTFSSVLNSDGSPGDDVVETVPLQQSTTVTLQGQKRYSLYLVDSPPNNGLSKGSTVTTPSGETREIAGSINSSYVRYGNVEARSTGSFFAEDDGEYTFDFATAKSGDSSAEVFLVDSTSESDLAFGIISFVGGIFLGVFLVLLAVGLGVGGIILWVLRNSTKKTQQRQAGYY